MNRSIIIASRELREMLSDTRFVYTIIVTGLVLPVFYAFVGMNAVKVAPGGIKSATFPLMFLLSSILPATFSMQLAVISFVGEKEARTIEPLLAAPITNMELFTGKVISSFFPPLVLVVMVQAIFLTASYILARVKFGMNFSPDFESIIGAVILVPLVVLTMVSLAVVISSKINTVRAAQQIGAFINLPILLLVVYKAPMLLHYATSAPGQVIGAGLAINVILLRAGARSFNRDKVLTQIG
ncbi:MAG: ABC transporter permease subunit [Firmicutes bacterium]|nr:ABC transporter permease subunit [Bacillota bacterium]